MEISTFPFLPQDDSLPFFQDSDPFSSINPPIDDLDHLSFHEILGALLLLDGQEQSDLLQSSSDSRSAKSLLDDLHSRKLKAMDDYFSTQLCNPRSDSDDFDLSRSKHSRRESAVAAVLSFGSSEFSSGSGGGRGGGGGQPQQQRRIWVKNRSNKWWEQCSSPNFPDEEFKKAFRMSKATFDAICDELEPVVTKKDTMLRMAIPVRQRVAVCVWRLATGEPLRLVSKRFGLGISTCHKLVLEVCSAIRNVLMPKYVTWPEESRMSEIRWRFESISGIPNICGAMHTTHIPITAPKVRVAQYFNKRQTERSQKTSYSLTVQGVVDHQGLFTDLFIGWPGSFSDDQVLENSVLYQKATGGVLNGGWVAGGRGYPLMEWMMVPYTHRNLTWTQHAFNEKIEEVEGVAKEAFMRLKARWSCLKKRTEMKLGDLPVVVGACCVLHNICEMRGEVMDDGLRFPIAEDDHADSVVPDNCVRSASSLRARDHIAHNLLHNNLSSTSFIL